MTATELFKLLARRWYVFVVVLALALVAFFSLLRSGGAYSSQVDVMFTAPGTANLDSNDGYRDTLVNFAAAVEREFHRGAPADRLAENASLFGAGVTQGYQVFLPNTGGQWQNSFSSPSLTIRVVGPSARWVLATQDELIARINELATSRQVASGVAAANLIQTSLVPSPTVIEHSGSSRSTQLRAFIALLATGAGLGVWAAHTLDRLAGRRRRPPHQTLGEFSSHNRKVHSP